MKGEVRVLCSKANFSCLVIAQRPLCYSSVKLQFLVECIIQDVSIHNAHVQDVEEDMYASTI